MIFEIDWIPSVSVIVPAFNAAGFIDRCIESLSRQTLEDFEVIVVDDGSTDGTAECVRRHSDRNLRLLQKPNGGTSSAKNLGLEHAKGEYVFFLDSDDWLEGPCLEEMHAAARAGDLDIVASDVYMDYPGKSAQYTHSSPPSAEWRTREGILSDLLAMRNVSWMATRLYRRSLFEDHRLRFEEGIHLSEDRILDLKLFFYARRVGKLDKAFLHYVRRKESLSSKRDRDYFGDIAAHHRIVQFITAAGLADRYRQELNYLEFRTLFLSLVSARQLDEQHFREYQQISANISRYGDNPLVRAYARDCLSTISRLRALAYRVDYRFGCMVRRLSGRVINLWRHEVVDG